MIAAFFCSLVEFNCPISLPLLTEDDLSENELLCELKQYMEAVYSGDCIL